MNQMRPVAKRDNIYTLLLFAVKLLLFRVHIKIKKPRMRRAKLPKAPTMCPRSCPGKIGGLATMQMKMMYSS